MKEQTVLPRRVRASYSTFVKVLTAIVLVACVACMYLLLPTTGLVSRLVWSLIGLLLIVFAGLAPMWFEEQEDCYVLRLVALSLTFDKAVYEATPVSSDEVDSAIRLFASGGYFGFTGWLWNRRLGRFRCFASTLNKPLVRIHRRGEERGGIIVNG